MKILTIVGARPNFMKAGPVHAAFLSAGHDAKLIHTGQHYDASMSEVFFEQLEMPRPDENLEVGSGSHAVQTARIMERFEPVLLREQPDWVMVAGDVNSTIACALVATKLHVRVAHLEAGLRSGDRGMPEEINRILTDQISDLLLTPSADADANLLREGIAAWRIARVGNAMIDSLRTHVEAARRLDPLSAFDLTSGHYALVTLHRPRNVDHPATLEALLRVLGRISERIPVVFPMHPRTRQNIAQFGLETLVESYAGGLRLVDPLGYLEFLALQDAAALVLTDSGGLQEETTVLGVPCLTLRENTERPITVSEGTNTVVGTRPEAIWASVQEVLAGTYKTGGLPELWDGHTAPRVVRALEDFAPG